MNTITGKNSLAFHPRIGSDGEEIHPMSKNLQSSLTECNRREIPNIGKNGGLVFQFLEKTGALSVTFLCMFVLLLFPCAGTAEAQSGSSSLGDFVWLDTNNDGVQDPGEPGYGGINVWLYTIDSGGTLTPFNVTITATNGYYAFSNLTSGAYVLEFSSPLLLHPTLRDAVSNDAIDSDPDRNSIMTPVIYLGDNVADTNWDCGLIPWHPGMQVFETAGNAPIGTTLYVRPGTMVTFNYTVINTGDTYFADYNLSDDFGMDVGGPVPEDYFPPNSVRTYATTNQIWSYTINNVYVGGLPIDFKKRPLGDRVNVSTNAVVDICPPPVILPPPDTNVECLVWADERTRGTNILGSISTLSNICDCVVTNITWEDTPVLDATNCPVKFAFDRTFTVYDDCGYSSSVVQRITIIDTTPPELIFTPPIFADITNECEATEETSTVSVVDCDELVVNYSAITNPGICPIKYTVERTWSAVDLCGNSIAVTQHVYVLDTTAPEIIVNWSNNETVVGCDDLLPASETYLPYISATDTCSGLIIVPLDPYPVQPLPDSIQSLSVIITTNDNHGTGLPGSPHLIEYVYKVSDPCGNAASVTQTIRQVCEYATIGDFVWNDVNKNGGQDPGELGVPGVVVTAYNVSSNSVGVTTSTVNGAYAFTNLPPGTYTIGFQLPGGYDFTIQHSTNFTDIDNSDADPDDGKSQSVTVLSGQVNTNIDAGIYEKTSYLVVNSFVSKLIGGRAGVVWTTEGESGTTGFEVWRRDTLSGEWCQISPMIPATGEGGEAAVYQFADNGAPSSGYGDYRLVEIESRGNRCVYGPFHVALPRAPPPAPAAAAMSVVSVTSPDAASVPAYKSRLSVAVATVVSSSQKPVSSVKVCTTGDGICTITAAQLASAFGRSVGDIQTRLSQAGLGVENQGRSVSVLTASSNITFYAQALSSKYTDQNVYWIRLVPAITMASRPVLPAPYAGDQCVRTEQTFEENHIARPDLFDDTSKDIWLWAQIAANKGISGTFNVKFDLAGQMADAGDSITLRLKGGQAGIAHQAVVKLNGAVIGTCDFSELDYVEQTLPVSGLKASGNVLSISDAGGGSSMFYLDNYTVNYKKQLSAQGDSLVFSADELDNLTVTGFSKSEIHLYNITDPLNPVVLTGGAIGGASGRYSISFRVEAKGAKYIAIAAGTKLSPQSIEPYVSSQIASSSNSADHLIISAAQLKTASQGIATYRTGRGLLSKVVSIDDVYDEFCYGIRDPEAIRKLIKFASKEWSKAPKYVLLVGRGSYDYKNYTGNNDCHVPSELLVTDYGLQTSDQAFSDLNSDGQYDIPVGRVPAATAVDVQNVLSKIKAYEAGGMWRRKSIALADHPDHGGNFPADSDQYAVSQMKGQSVHKIYVKTTSTQELVAARTALRGSLKLGAGLFTYFGHATQYRMALESLLGRADVPALGNASHPPIVSAMTCLIGNFGTPGIVSLGQMLVISNSGAVALIGAGSQVYNVDSRVLCANLLGDIYSGQYSRLGDAMLSSWNHVAQSGYAELSHAYNLLGDPALEIKPRSAISGLGPAFGSIRNDFDGDGRSDLSLYSPRSGTWLISKSSFGTTSVKQWGWKTSIPVTADYDGDGIADYAIFDPASGNWFIIYSSSKQSVTKNWGAKKTIPVPADYDGDGIADIAVYDATQGNWFVKRSSNGLALSVQWGTSNSIPVPADYDGDGQTDLAVYDTKTGVWSVLESSTASARTYNCGWASAMPVQGDYDGDGKVDVAVYHQASGQWFIRQSADGLTRQISLGSSMQVPVPGDYDGDGLTDAAVYDKASLKWTVLQSSTGTAKTTKLGSSGSLPVLLQYQINRLYFPSL